MTAVYPFLKGWGPFPELNRLWLAYIGSEPRPAAHGVNPRGPLGLKSHFGLVRHELLYRLALKITEKLKPYHDDKVGTQSASLMMIMRIYFECWNLSR